MAIIQQLPLFSWRDFHQETQSLGDLKRLKLVMESLPDKELMKLLEDARGRGRNLYPVKAMWNAILAGIVFEHVSIESLRRELQRNAQLREMCGFSSFLGEAAVPSKSTFSRFIATLVQHQAEIDTLFNGLVKELGKILPEFGSCLAGDGKAIQSLGKPPKRVNGDRRREEEADFGKKVYRGVTKEGAAWEKCKSWFGFRLHLIVDAESELPVSYKVTKASLGEQPIMRQMFADLKKEQPEMMERCEYAIMDKGYDCEESVASLWDTYKIKPIIDIRNMRKGEETRLLKQSRISNVTYDYKGTVFCHCPKSGIIKKLSYGGFEKERGTLKYVCPVLAYGIECEGASECPLYKKSVRIPLEEDRRVFTPVPRSSQKWERLYRKRTSVERVNSRIDVSFGFERHYIRGLKKMKLRCGLALSTMLAMAVGRLRQKQPELMRSLVRAAA